MEGINMTDRVKIKELIKETKELTSQYNIDESEGRESYGYYIENMLKAQLEILELMKKNI